MEAFALKVKETEMFVSSTGISSLSVTRNKRNCCKALCIDIAQVGDYRTLGR